MGDRYRSPPRRRDSPPRDRGPPPRRRDSRPPDRAPPQRRRSASRPRNPPGQGRFKITIEGIPDDMSWKELKDLGRESGDTLTFSRTYQSNRISYGMLEYSDRQDAEAALRDLDNRRVEGCRDRIRSHWGDLAGDGKLGQYNGFGEYDGRDGGRGGGDRGGNRGGDRKSGRSRSPPRRRSLSRRRSPPRKGGGKGGGGDDPIMTLFVKELPDDAKDSEISEDIDRSAPVLRCMVMRKNGCCAFVRFGSVEDAERAMQDLNDGTCKVAGKRCGAEMAKRNTEVTA